MEKTSAAGRGALCAIVLAAGGSSRLGRAKQLLRYRGEPLIVRAARLAQGAVDGGVIVVLGAARQRLRSLLRWRIPSVAIVANGRWPEGLATSLAAGLQHVPPTAAGVLFLLVDQPGIAEKDLARLVAHWRRRPGRPAAAFYAGRPAAPAVIPRRFFAEIRRLEGDVGARQLLRGLGRPTLVTIEAGRFDVDTPEDAAALASGTSGV